MNKIKNSSELLELIKKAAKNDKNWVTATHLKLRLGFGAKVLKDHVCSPDDFKPDGNMNEEELLFSQNAKDDARDKFVGNKHSNVMKDAVRIFGEYLDLLYNSEDSILHHGFLKEMRNTIKDTLLLNRTQKWVEKIIVDMELPSDSDLNRLLEFTRKCDSKNWTKGLHPTRDLFPPIVPDSREPPTFTLWKKTKNGIDFFGKQRTHTIPSNSSIDISTGQDASVPVREITLTTNRTDAAKMPSLIGLIEIHTGVKTTKMKYCTNPEMVENSTKYLGTSTTLYNLMKMTKRWKKYDDAIEERFYNLMKPDGPIFTTYTKEELHHDSIHDVLSMMKLERHECIKFECGIRNKKIESLLADDVEDDMSE